MKTTYKPAMVNQKKTFENEHIKTVINISIVILQLCCKM